MCECCLGAHCVSSWRSYGLKQGISWHFFSLCLYYFYVFLFMKSVNMFLIESTLCQLMDQLRPSTGNPLAFLCFSFLYWFMSSCSWKSYKFYCLGAHCVSSWSRYRLIQALHWYFFSLCFYWFISSCSWKAYTFQGCNPTTTTSFSSFFVSIFSLFIIIMSSS